MAKGRKTGGKNFAKGNPGGPGRPATPEPLRSAKRLTKLQFEAIVNQYLWMPIGALEAMADSPNIEAIDSVLISGLITAKKTGNWSTIEWILTRLIGKVKDQVEVTAKPYIIERLDGSQLLLGSKELDEPEG